MSRITNIILCVYGSTYHSEGILPLFVDELNKKCFGENFGFIPVDMGSLKTGGPKTPIGLALMGGFNFLNLKRFLSGVKNFDYTAFSLKHSIDRPYCIDVFYLIEDDENGYHHVKISPRDSLPNVEVLPIIKNTNYGPKLREAARRLENLGYKDIADTIYAMLK